MQIDKIRSSDSRVVEGYILKKFTEFNGLTYSSSSRKKKCIAYYLAAKGSPHGQAVIERIYQQVFKQILPDPPAPKAGGLTAGKKSSDDWLDEQGEYAVELTEALAVLKLWKATNMWQEGESFYAGLVTRVQFVDESICNQQEFQSEYSAVCRSEITSSAAVNDKEREAKFALMVGVEQAASCAFEARSMNWGLINGKLDESFKAGIWSSGTAKLKMDRLGFSAEMQAAIAIGAQLNLEGDLRWSSKGGKGVLVLGGTAEVFVGARASAETKLSVSARTGLEASIKAGCFAGFSAKAEGTCSFSYDGKEIASATASAGILFGAGAEFEASIKAPIFGPTEISFAASAAVGLGVSSAAAVSFSFNAAALASSQQFRQMVYWRTMAKGYEMTLMNSDAKNLYYLNKSIKRLGDELESTTDAVDSFNRMPLDKRPLLVS
jgi:hypothetical protein